MKREVFRDFYGCSASITKKAGEECRLVIRDNYGRKIHAKTYSTHRGARIAMGRMSDAWRQV